jgi:hypothetical protein
MMMFDQYREGGYQKGVRLLISSWEQLNAGGGGGAMELEIPTGRNGRGMRKSQKFRDLCQKFDGKKKEGVRKDAKMKSGRVLDYSFENVAGTSPGPNVERGDNRK